MKIPSEAIKQFVVGTIVPVVAAAGAAWLASKGALNVFGISKATATTDLDELGVFVVVAGSGWLTSHHILLGHYSKAAKAAGVALLSAEAADVGARSHALAQPMSLGTIAPSQPVQVHIHNGPDIASKESETAKGPAK